VIFSGVCLLVRCLLRCLMVRGRREVCKDAGLLVLRHENAVLRRQLGRVRCQHGDRRWLAALSRLIPRGRGGEVFAVTPATLLAWHPGPIPSSKTNCLSSLRLARTAAVPTVG
jgi:putative transposase